MKKIQSAKFQSLKNARAYVDAINTPQWIVTDGQFFYVVRPVDAEKLHKNLGFQYV